MYDLVIVGGGITAFGAAVYAGRFHMKTLVIGENMGGTLLLTDEVENYPGFKRVTGQELFDQVKNHAMEYNVETSEQKVERIEKKGDCFVVDSVDRQIEAKTVLIATGSEWKKLDVPGEKEFTGNGVHYCALCDGYAYQDRVVAIVGGSDSAAKEAVLLAQYAKKVYIIYRKGKLRAEPINAKRVEDNEKIEVVFNNNVTEIHGDRFVNKVILEKQYNGSTELELDGVFINIGHIPLSDMVKGLGVDMKEKGEIKIDRWSMTSVEGLFAAGDVTDFKFKQAITGVAQGVAAVYSAYQCCREESIKT